MTKDPLRWLSVLLVWTWAIGLLVCIAGVAGCLYYGWYWAALNNGMLALIAVYGLVHSIRWLNEQ